MAVAVMAVAAVVSLAITIDSTIKQNKAAKKTERRAIEGARKSVIAAEKDALRNIRSASQGITLRYHERLKLEREQEAMNKIQAGEKLDNNTTVVINKGQGNYSKGSPTVEAPKTVQ